MQVYELVTLQSIYSEDYVYGGGSVVTGSWNTGPLHYLFRRVTERGDNKGAVVCEPNSTVVRNANIPGGDFLELREPASGSWGACAAACEAEPRCQGWTYDCCNNSHPGSAGCYLKSTVSEVARFHGDVAGCSSRGVSVSRSACCQSRTTAANYTVPPHGMRSAISLGPVGGGSLELRADGRLADWRMLNNQPPIGTKVSPESASFALQLTDANGVRHTTLLRTHSPEPNLPTVESMQYSGAFPVSRIEIVDNNLSYFVQHNPVRLYGVSAFKMHDPKASSVPAVSFVIDVPQSNATEVAVMLSLPAALLGDGTAVAGADGRVYFTQDKAGDRQGQIVLSASRADGKALSSVSWQAAGNLSTLVSSFSSGGGVLANVSHTEGNAAHGAIAAKIQLPWKTSGASTYNGERTLVHITLSWYLPMRHWSHGELIGQAYANHFAGAAEVATQAESPDHLVDVLQDAAALQSLYFNNSLLPDWLQDGLVNSLSALYKTGMWLDDGRYRQFESFSCPQIENPHIQKPRCVIGFALFILDV